MAAEIRDSNLLGLTDIINRDNIQQEQLNAIEDLDGSVGYPSHYDDFRSLLRYNSGEDESDSESSEYDSAESQVSTKTKADKAQEYDSEEYDEESDYDSSSKSDRDRGRDESESGSSSSDIGPLKDPFPGKIKGVVNLTPSDKGKTSGGKEKEAHAKILSEIDTMKSVLIKRGIPVPNYKPKDVKRKKSHAEEILGVLKNLDSDNKTADDMTHLLRFVLNILCKTLNGRHELFGYKMDLRGYKTLVMSDMKDVREDTVQFASYVRKKLGISTMKIFLIFRIFILNAALTIVKNNESDNNVDIFDDEQEEYSEDDVSAEEEEEDEELEEE